MEQNIELNDISDELLIIPKATIDALMKLDNCSECIALYIFYYKTAKWQKRNQIKANDEYVKKSLKWGIDKVKKCKKILKENGLIEIIQKRIDGKIQGWYIKVNYLISHKKIDDIKIKVINNTYMPLVDEATSGTEDTSALKEYIKCLLNKIEVLEKNKNANNKDKKLIKNKYGEYGNVTFTDEQYEKLKNEFPTDYEQRIQNVDAYVQSTGKKYKDYLATIRNWARKEKNNSYKKEFKEMETSESW